MLIVSSESSCYHGNSGPAERGSRAIGCKLQPVLQASSLQLFGRVLYRHVAFCRRYHEVSVCASWIWDRRVAFAKVTDVTLTRFIWQKCPSFRVSFPSLPLLSLWGCVCWCPRPWLGWCPSQGCVHRWPHPLPLLFCFFRPFFHSVPFSPSLSFCLFFSLSFAGDSEPLRSLTKAWLTETFTYKLGVPEHLLSFPENLAADEALQRRLYSMALLLGNSLSQQTKAGAAHGTLAQAAVWLNLFCSFWAIWMLNISYYII